MILDINSLTKNEAQIDYISKIWVLFGNHTDDAEDVANFTMALYKLYMHMYKELCEKGTPDVNGNIVLDANKTQQLLEDARNDWPTPYEKWEQGQLPDATPFQNALFQAYREGSEDDKARLAMGFYSDLFK